MPDRSGNPVWITQFDTEHSDPGGALVRLGAPILLLACLSGCAHSDSFPTGPQEPGGPFGNDQPLRLTLNPADDIWPTISGPGELSYQFGRGTADHDLCAGVLPSGGGHRIAEVCAWAEDDSHRYDQFGAAVILPGDQLAWTWHAGLVGGRAPSVGGLYLGPANAPEDAILKLALLTRPAGASARWDVLIDPQRTGDNEITALAAQWFIGPTVQYGPDETLYFGVEIARIDLATTPATVHLLAPAPDAVAWAFDASDSSIYFERTFYAPDTPDKLFGITADTIYRVTAGSPVAVWGRPTPATDVVTTLDGFAVTGGRLFVSLTTLRIVGPPEAPRPSTESTIAEVIGGVTGAPLVARHNGGRWGRLTIDADGYGLIAESSVNGARDLYRVAVNP